MFDILSVSHLKTSVAVPTQGDYKIALILYACWSKEDLVASLCHCIQRVNTLYYMARGCSCSLSSFHQRRDSLNKTDWKEGTSEISWRRIHTLASSWWWVSFSKFIVPLLLLFRPGLSDDPPLQHPKERREDIFHWISFLAYTSIWTKPIVVLSSSMGCNM